MNLWRVFRPRKVRTHVAVDSAMQFNFSAAG